MYFPFWCCPLLLWAGVALGQIQPPVTSDPIAFVGHGAAFGPDGKEINLTPRFIREAQQYYIDSLYRIAPLEKKLSFDRKRNDVLSTQLTGQDELVANSALIEFLINEVKVQDGGRLSSINSFLKVILRSKLPLINQPLKFSDAEKYEAPRALASVLEKELSLGIKATSVDEDRIKYINECTDAGVPIPPDWGDKQHWEPKGRLTQLFISAKQFPIVDVYAYVSTKPEGLCFALPRSETAEAQIELLGIICLGKQSGKACFWDNQKNKQRSR